MTTDTQRIDSVLLSISNKLDAAERRKEQMANTGLGGLMEKATSDFLKNLDSMVKERENTLAKAQNALDLTIAARDMIRKSLDPSATTKPGGQRQLYWFPSKSRPDSTGHYVELKNNTATCSSCESGQYNGYCWASKLVAHNPMNVYTYNKYPNSDNWFDARVKP